MLDSQTFALFLNRVPLKVISVVRQPGWGWGEELLRVEVFPKIL